MVYSWGKNYKILAPAANTTMYGLLSIKMQSIEVWNFMVSHYNNINFIEKVGLSVKD